MPSRITLRRFVASPVFILGASGGVLLTLLRWTEYQFLVLSHALALYGALTAITFSTLGILLGLHLTRKPEPPSVAAPLPPAISPSVFIPDPARREALNITPRELEILALVAQGLSKPRDRRATLRQREHRQDPLQPRLRQTRRSPPHPGRPVRQRARHPPLADAQPSPERMISAPPAKIIQKHDDNALPFRAIVTGNPSPPQEHAHEESHPHLRPPLRRPFGRHDDRHTPVLHQLGSGSAGYLFGYTAIVLSSLLVFFGIRSYRDNVAGGRITFGKGFLIGLAITLISCAFYVVTWEIVYFKFMHGLMDPYFAQMSDKVRASGVTGPALQAKLDQIQHSRALYENPLYNAAMTFMEPFPVGLLITLISAAILRRKTPVDTAVPATA